MAYYLGVDIGTTAMKAVIIDEEGRDISFAFTEYQTIEKDENKVEQDAEEWWSKLSKVIKKVTKPIHPDEVKALCLSTQGGTIIPVDKEGGPLRKAILWMDNRALEQSNRLNQELGEDYWYFHSGKRIQPTSPLPKLLWLKQREGKLFKNTCKFLQLPDYLNYKLTGEFIIDVSNASYSSFFELKKKSWDEEILNKWGIEKDKLAEIKDSGISIGRLTPRAANFLNLAPSTYVITGAHDQTCAAVGAGINKEGELLLSMGTAWVLYGVLSTPRFSKNKLYTLCCYAFLQQWCYLIAMNGSVVSDWFIQNFCQEEVKKSRAQKIPVSCLLLGNGDNTQSDIIFLPHLYGALAPHYSPSSKGAILGLSLKTTKHDILLAIMESLIFEVRWNLEILQKEGFHFKELKIAGGASKNKKWVQMTANILNLPVKQVQSEESAAKGAALLAYIGIGGKRRFPSSEADTILFPDKNKEEIFAFKFSLYKKSFHQFKKIRPFFYCWEAGGKRR